MRTVHILFAVVFTLSLASCDEQTPALSGELYLDLPVEAFRYSEDSLTSEALKTTIPTLGRVLFYDRQLSLNNTIACGSCHKQSRGFADDVALSRGYGNKRTSRNSMPIQNLKNHFFPAFFNGGSSSSVFPGNQNVGTLFWDGREKNLEEMVLRPIVNHVEMGITDMNALADKLQELSYYSGLFNDAYGDSEITKERIATALNSFVSSIESTNTKLDQAFSVIQSSSMPGTNPIRLMLTDLEGQGFNLFLTKYDCNSCHQVQTPGGYLGGGASGGPFANIGLDEAYKDNGLSNVTRSPGDAGKFKIPSLRNVALTGPYMHDGRFEKLEDVIDHYSESISNHPNLDTRLRGANGKARRMHISDSEKEALIAFLNALTDEQMVTDPRFSDPFKFKAE